MNTLNAISEKIKNAKELEFGTVFNDSIELFKKTWVQGLLLQLFNIIIMLPLIIVLYIPLIGMIIAQQQSGYANPDAFNTFFASMSVIYIVFVLVGAIVLGTISAALYAAFFKIMKKIDYNQEVKTSDFFYFIKGKYLGKILTLIVLMVLIAVPSVFLCYIPLLYFLVPMSFFAVIFAFNEDFSVGDVIKVSFQLGNKKWLLSFGLIVVSYICVLFLTLVTCGLGSLFLKPFMYHPVYLIYKNVIGFDSQTPIDEIGPLAE